VKKILVMEPFPGGHREHFLKALADEIRRRRDRETHYVFVVAESSEIDYPSGVTVDRVPVSETERLSGWNKKRAMGRLLEKRVQKYQPDEVILLELTQYEWPLLWKKLSVTLSAIVFVQPPHIPSRLKREFKFLKTRLLLCRNVWRTLYFLNGDGTARVLRERFKRFRTEFLGVPDPVIGWAEGDGASIDVDAGRSTALYFGAVSKRKGFGVLVDALLMLPDTIQNRLEVVICGKPEDPVYFRDELNRLRGNGTSLKLTVEASFLEESRVHAYFDACDWVLMPYTRPEYSSGVLGLAARAGKPVLGPENGLLGSLIQEYGLGRSCAITSGSLKNEIEKAVTSGISFNRDQAAAYAAERTPEAFARILLGRNE
jgi:glycosyltransferase involved in cell wall biosynthesis